METTTFSFTVLFCTFGMFIFFLIIFLAASVRIVQEDKRLSVYRLGRYLGDKGPGLVIIIPIIDRGVIKELGGQTPISAGQRVRVVRTILEVENE